MLAPNWQIEDWLPQTNSYMCQAGTMAMFVYIDETGSVGKGSNKQPQLILVAVIVDENKVRPLSESIRQIAESCFEFVPQNFEFHGVDLWHGNRPWKSIEASERLEVYKELIGLLDLYDLDLAHSTIDKQRLHDRYNGVADNNAYLLALQFLLQKIDQKWEWRHENKIVIADEAKNHHVNAVDMVASLQESGMGEVPGPKFETIIDSLHFVRSEVSPGVQMADLVAFILQRCRYRPEEGHPIVQEVRSEMIEAIAMRTRTYRQAWP